MKTAVGAKFGFVQPVEEPEVGLMLSQLAFFEAVQLRIPPAGLETERVLHRIGVSSRNCNVRREAGLVTSYFCRFFLDLYIQNEKRGE